MKGIYVVLAVWSVIVGGILFLFENGKIIKICIACNGTLFVALGVISIVLGLAGLATAGKIPSATAGRQ